MALEQLQQEAAHAHAISKRHYKEQVEGISASKGAQIQLLWDAFALPPPNLLAASAQILGQPHQATAPTGREGRGIHIVLDLLHALCEMLRAFVELAVRKLSVQQPTNVGDHGFVEVDITELLDHPSGAVANLSNPTAKASAMQGLGQVLLQPVVSRRNKVAGLVVDNRPRQVCPTILPLHLCKQLGKDVGDKLAEVLGVSEFLRKVWVRGRLLSINDVDRDLAPGKHRRPINANRMIGATKMYLN